MSMQSAENIRDRLVAVVVETVEDAHPNPMPEGHLYLALTGIDLNIDQYQRLICLAVGTGQIQRGPYPHTLTVGDPIDRLIGAVMYAAGRNIEVWMGT